MGEAEVVRAARRMRPRRIRKEVKKRRRGLSSGVFLFLLCAVQLFQVVPQGEIDIAGDRSVVVFCQPFDSLIDGFVQGNADPYFQWFHNITYPDNSILANTILTTHIR